MKRIAGNNNCLGKLETHLLLLLDQKKLLLLELHVLGLDSHNSTSPLALEFLVLVEGSEEAVLEGSKGLDVIGVDVGQRDGGCGLLVDKSSKTRFALDDAEGNVLLTAELGQPADELNGVNVVGNNDELGRLVLDELGDVVESVFKLNGLLSGVDGLSVLLLLGNLNQSLLLLLASLRGVLVQESQKLGGLVLVNSIGKLGNGWGNLKTLEKDSLLTLKLDELGPFGETGQVTGRLDVSTGTEVTGALFEEHALLDLLGLLGGQRGREGGLLRPSFLLNSDHTFIPT